MVTEPLILYFYRVELELGSVYQIALKGESFCTYNAVTRGDVALRDKLTVHLEKSLELLKLHHSVPAPNCIP